MEIAGKTIQIDLSGRGHNWVEAEGEALGSVQAEIECEIIDGKRESCDNYLASNGVRYRW